jgi:hypothetical protein
LTELNLASKEGKGKKMNHSDKNLGAQEHSEGPVAKAIERETAKLPSDLFLWAAGGSIAASLAFRATGRREASEFVGQWVAPILLLGVYNKIVKVAGSDKQSQ